MPNVNRGSKHKLAVIAESALGTTPATPTLVEMPIRDFNKQSTPRLARSGQLRSHPYLDRLLLNGYNWDLTCAIELQPATHDPLFQAMFGGVITSSALKVADAISSLTAESQAGGSTALFDQFAGMYFTKLDVGISAGATDPIVCTFTGRAKTGTLDAATTIATAVTAAPAPDPYVFSDATITLNGSARPVTSMNFSLSRTVTEEMVLGSQVFREAIPDAVTLTGSIMVPFEDALESARYEGFADVPIVARAASRDGSTFRRFTIPKAKYVKFGRQINTRGGIMQSIDFEALYDSASQTVLTMATE